MISRDRDQHPYEAPRAPCGSDPQTFTPRWAILLLFAAAVGCVLLSVALLYLSGAYLDVFISFNGGAYLELGSLLRHASIGATFAAGTCLVAALACVAWNLVSHDKQRR